MSKSAVAMLAAVAAALMVLLMARSVLDHVPLYDELLHYLSAQGLIHVGRPVIAHGEYTRALLFTQLVAESMRAFGESLRVARLPALLAAALLAGGLAAWVTKRVDPLAGLAAALLLVLVPTTVEMAVFVRFYTLHALLIFVVAVAVYQLSMPDCRRWQRLLSAAVVCVVTPLAWQLQPTTLIAGGAIASGFSAICLFDRWPAARQLWAEHKRLIASAIAVAAALLMLSLALPQFKSLRALNVAPVWASWAADRPHYYLMVFSQRMPLLWPLFPVAVALAWQRHRRLTLYSTTIFISALAVHSLAAAKAERYLYYAMPFFCVVWGCAICAAGQLLKNWVERNRLGRWHQRLLIGATLLAVLALSSEGQRGARLLLASNTPQEILSYAGEPDWQIAVARLKLGLADRDRVVTSNAMKALYYLGRYDFELNASIVAETSTGHDMGMDSRTGGRAIGRAESLRQIIDMPGKTLVVLEDRKLRTAVGVSVAAVDLLQERCTPVTLPADSGLSAWHCEGS